jgi:scyllo-inositol 2-dehydrogenase (NADP+)
MSSSSDSIAVGLVGFGVSGRFFHAPFIHAVPGLRLAAIVQRTGDSAHDSYPEAAIVRTVDDLLEMDQIQLVVVATPNTTHAPIAARCLEAGRHVVVDKPFAPSSAEAARVAALAAERGRVLSVFHNRRWDGDFLTLQQLLASGVLGRPVSFQSRFDRFRPLPKAGAWRERAEPGSGVLFDLGPHLVDQALALFGMPEAITGDVRVERHGVEADDAFDVTLHYPAMRAVLSATMLAAARGPRFVVHGRGGSFVKHGVDPQEAALRSGAVPGTAGWGEEPERGWGVLTRPSDGGVRHEPVKTLPGDYRRVYENVRDAIRGTAALAVTAEHATRVVRLLELAVQSSRERRTVAVSGVGSN